MRYILFLKVLIYRQVLFLLPKEREKNSVFQTESYPEGKIYRSTLDYKSFSLKSSLLFEAVFLVIAKLPKILL